MKTFASQLKWQFIILAKNNIITISVVVTIIYAFLFYGIKDLGNTDKILTFLIYNDTAIISLFFIGIGVIMEKNQDVLPALFVTPINFHVYLLSRIVALSLVGWVCGLSMAFFALGTSFNVLHFSAGIFGICVLCCLGGLYMVCFTADFLMFMLKSIPILFIFVTPPLLNYFAVTDIALFRLLPTQGPLDLMEVSYQSAPRLSQVLFGYLSQVIWIPFLYALIYRTFMSKVVNV